MSFQEKQAELIYKAVKRAAIPTSSVDVGDLIVVTASDDDTVGVVTNMTTENDSTVITLRTADGDKTRVVGNSNFIHMLQKDAMLSLRNHNDYERTDDEVDMLSKDKKKHKERPEFTDEKSDKSALPTSKISSLSLRKSAREASTAR